MSFSLPRTRVNRVRPQQHFLFVNKSTMKTAILASLIAAASAFAPAKVGQTSTSLNSYEGELGTIAPTGYWDPLGYAKRADPAQFDYYRALELKHGRVAMLCVLGYIVPEFTRANYDFTGAGEITTATVRNGLLALQDIPPLGLVQILFFIGYVDQTGVLGDFEFGKPDLGPLEEKRKLQEIQHCRLAMLASLELLRHDFVTNIAGTGDGLGPNLVPGLPWLYN